MVSVGNRNMRILLGACGLLVGFQLIYFHHQNRAGDVSSLVLAGASVESSPKPVLSGETNRGVIRRKYFDDRENGLLVVATATGKVEANDYETQELDKLYAQHRLSKDPNKFQIHEIKQYDYSTLESEPRTLLLDDARLISHFREKFVEFMSELVRNIADAKPLCGGINNDAHYEASRKENAFPNRKGRIPVYGGHWRESYTDEPVRTKEYLLYFFRATDSEVEALSDSHDKFIRSMPRKFPLELYDLGKPLDFMTGDGIVYLGGGKYNQLVLLSISMLRASGLRLPIEVILPKRSDHDIDLCNNILPTYNGRCKIMEDYLPELLMNNLGGFQLKNAALLVSSFRRILYLDADNIPMANPDNLFVNDPFTNLQLVIWPDLWRRSTSPQFYEATGVSYNEKWRMRNSYFGDDAKGTAENKPSLHDCQGTIPDASSETGQMMIDKEKHFQTLVLAMYYNYYGPDYYYPLLSQGAAGEGDKETFIAAAHRLGLLYYQVNEFNREFGPVDTNNKHEFFGMGQYDPIIDYIESMTPDLRNKPGEFAANDKDGSRDNYNFHYYKSHGLMFLHANWPKYYISEMFLENSSGRGHKNREGNRRRLYTLIIKDEMQGVDVEVEIMRHVKHWFCSTDVRLQNLPDPGTNDRKAVCKEIQEQIKYLQG